MFSIFKIPRDVASLIFKCVPLSSYSSLALVSKEALSITQENELWIFSLRKMGISSTLLEDIFIKNMGIRNLKRVYFQLRNLWNFLQHIKLNILDIVFATRNIPFIDEYLQKNQILFDQELVFKAATTADLQTIKWLIEIKQIRYTPDILGRFAALSPTSIFSYLLNGFREAVFIPLKSLLCLACRSGNFENACFLIDQKKVEINAGICNEAIRGGHLSLLINFVEVRNYQLVGQNLSAAYTYNQKDIIDYMECRKQSADLRQGTISL